MRSRSIALSALAAVVLAGACTSTSTPSTPPSPAATPSTDVYVYRLSRGFLPFRQRVFNITNRSGYDNQPSFNASTIYFTSQRSGQTDIYKYEDGQVVQVTATPESEYSAALTPDGRAITVVRVERDSTQRLWQFPLDGSSPSLVLQDIKPVGYFAWLDSTTLALFVLGNPNTLQIADTRTGRGSTVTTNIGRSLQRVPGGRRASFVQRDGGRWMLKTVDPTSRADGTWDIETVAALPDSADYVAWKSANEVYTASGSRLMHLVPPAKSWELVADLARYGIRHITRLALHPNGREIAVVADDPR